MKSGIYLITNTVNGKVYVGKSVRLQDRRWQHITDLRGGYHDNLHLQNAWNKYGEDVFTHAVLEYCEADTREELEILLVEREDWWMTLLDSRNPDKGYNKRSSQFSLHSEETKRKIGAGLAGHAVSDSTREKLRKANLGKAQTPEQKAKQRQAQLGRPGHPNTIAATVARNVERAQEWLVIDLDGNTHKIRNLNVFCQDNNLNPDGMYKVACGMQKHHRGGRCERVGVS